MGTGNRILMGVAAGALGLFVLVSLLRPGGGTDAGPISGPRSTASEREIALRLEEPESVAPPREDSTVGLDPTSPPAPLAAPKDEPIRDLLALPVGTIAEMQAKRDAIHKELGERSTPILFQRLDDNLSEIVATGDSYSPADRDKDEIYALRRDPGGPWYRAALSRSDYPELYELKDARTRLDDLIRDAQVREALAKAQKALAKKKD